ncbi:DUF2570 domain-containing protein [Yersinia vastinensis]|uniref:DUF2570 domain-containing protein n=1 Tax=Yersinia vastinensis TaxID=2890318 RepID=UPI0005E2801F|nr:DUF2570 domain-containing protein [Yersinia vastinensis]OVZ97884.1 DUF2570 domain-containing protein [Yersinia frederiksenii]CNH82906.1 putative phage antitermination protein Q [Yersinia frederiksenii]CNI70001.1 putative phage antitermination protein Q [Yersinia frederiksenii]CNJ99485.1 putative phage antitermination protein Q [Yersinia frederiksenii]
MKTRIVTAVALLLLLLGLMANAVRLSAKQRQVYAELQAQQVVNQTLGNIIDTYQLNDAANRAAVARQLESERTLRHETEDRLKRFAAAAATDSCAAHRMPESGINILRE